MKYMHEVYVCNEAALCSSIMLQYMYVSVLCNSICYSTCMYLYYVIVYVTVHVCICITQ